MHQAACAEEDLHGREVGMPARPEYVYELIRGDLVRDHMGSLEDVLLLRRPYLIDNTDDLLIVEIHHFAFLHERASFMTSFALPSVPRANLPAIAK